MQTGQMSIDWYSMVHSRTCLLQRHWSLRIPWPIPWRQYNGLSLQHQDINDARPFLWSWSYPCQLYWQYLQRKLWRAWLEVQSGAHHWSHSSGKSILTACSVKKVSIHVIQHLTVNYFAGPPDLSSQPLRISDRYRVSQRLDTAQYSDQRILYAQLLGSSLVHNYQQRCPKIGISAEGNAILSQLCVLPLPLSNNFKRNIAYHS